jgi:hypothetical protein
VKSLLLDTHAVDYLLGLIPKSASMISIDDIKSLSLSSTGNINKKMKPRPCLIWQANPLVALLMAHFEEMEVNDPNFPYGSLPEEFVRRRLLPIHPKKTI